MGTEIMRLNYFNGQFLKQEDFTDEQLYHMFMRQNHNKGVHTKGVVYGLNVEVVPGLSQVTINDGWAIDKDGREVFYSSETKTIDDNGEYYANLSYDEDEDLPQPIGDTGIPGNRRIKEGAEVVIDAVPGEGEIVLAKITKDGAVLTVEDLRQFNGLQVPGSIVLGKAPDSETDPDERVTLANSSGEMTIDSAVTISGHLTADEIDIGGLAYVSGDLTVTGNLEVLGDTIVRSTDQVEGDVILGDNDNDKVTIEGSLQTGNSSGNLEVKSPVNIAGSITATAATINGDFDVTGVSTFAQFNSTSDASFTGSVNIGVNLGVGGVSTLGATTVTGNMEVTGTTTVEQLTANSAASFNNAVDVSGDLGIGGAASVTGDLSVAGNLLVQGDTVVRSTDQVEGNVVLGNEDIDTVTISGTLQSGHSSGSLQLMSPLACNNGVDVTGDVSISGLLQGVNIIHAEQIANGAITIDKLDGSIPIGGGSADLGRVHRVPLLQQTLFRRPFMSMSIPFSPHACAYDGSHIWVCDNAGGRVVKIDVVTNSIVAEVNGLTGPTSLAFDGTFLWVSNFTGDAVTKIDVITNVIVTTISGILRSDGFAFDGNFLWASSRTGDAVYKIDVNTNLIVNSVALPAGSQPHGLVFDGVNLWTSNTNGASISKIDVVTNNLVNTIAVGSAPWDLAFDGESVWVSCFADDTVFKIDINNDSILNKLAATGGPRGVVFDGSHLWVSSYTSGALSKIDVGSDEVLATISGFPSAYSLAFDGESVWCSNNKANMISKIRKAV